MELKVVFFGLFFIFAETMAATKNLTAIRWAHAVNSQQLLDESLNGPIDMIEADIVLGTLTNNVTAPEQPVMGHPPATTSDISLDSFLRQILEFNNKNSSATKKGVKLDFKSTEVFNGSQALLRELWPLMDYPVWINADILSGPVNNTETRPVDADIFLQACKNFTNAVLSIGWTTRWGKDFRDGTYETDQIDTMTSVIRNNSVPNDITFPIRAGIAANSKLELQNLYLDLNRTNNVTMTVWSSAGDYVDVKKLKELILAFGVDKVYLDVPKELEDKLDLGSSGALKLGSGLKWMGYVFLALNVIVYKMFY
ncbi:protein FAM151B [Culicoides brevitarsis]|uniref:protein FAM151B n=1 Tax=Culicoides brevitarsis TaxID=469753 RepID=UPI00307C8B5E